jgi:hypothetical protein
LFSPLAPSFPQAAVAGVAAKSQKQRNGSTKHCEEREVKPEWVIEMSQELFGYLGTIEP